MDKSIAIVTDVHFGIRKNSEIFLKSSMNFFIEQFIPYLKENGITKIAFLGDLFDNRINVHLKIHNEVYSLFRNHLKDFDIYILVGNHDTYYNSTIDVHSIQFLKLFDNVTVIDTTTVVDVYGRKILMVPWLVDQKEIYNIVKEYDADIIFGHFDIRGFYFNKYKISDEGISVDTFSNKYKKVFSGHFHTRSSRLIGNTEFVYVGSPYQTSRNDIDEERGFVVLDLDTLRYKYIDNNVSLKYIKLEFPQRFTKKMVEGNLIDIYIKYDDSYKESKIEKYLNKIESYNPITRPYTFILNNGDLESEFNISECHFGSITNLMRDYVDSLDIDNKEKVIEILIGVYNKTKGEY
ncbi:MAG: metallophosphoesterase [Candidatus Pacearchaeota archaeon]